MRSWIGPISPGVRKVLEPSLLLNVAVEDVGPDVKVASSYIERHQDINRIVGAIGNHNNGRSKGQCPHKDNTDPRQPSVSLGKTMITMTCPDECRDYKDDGVSTEHAVTTPVQQESGEEFPDRMHATIAWIGEGCDGDGRDAHQVTEGPGQQDLT